LRERRQRDERQQQREEQTQQGHPRSIPGSARRELTPIKPIHWTAMRRAWVLPLLLLVFPCAAERLHDARPLMGTVVEVVAEGPDRAALQAAAQEAFQEMQRLADMMSHYDPRSVVSGINRAAGVRAVPVPAELAEVLRLARRISERTGGAFDITVGGSPIDYRKLRLDREGAFLEEKGMRVDPGGIAKLYILEAGRRRLEARGVARALVNGGGDVVAHSSGEAWRVGVRDPRAPGALLGRLEVRNGAVASSGDYEKPGHVIDPRTGRPARGARGVTLAGPVEAVNGLGPAIMVLGLEAGKQLVAAGNVEALIVGAQGEAWTSPGLRLLDQ
jgi:thiamine biosynthesis lipoprotein